MSEENQIDEVLDIAQRKKRAMIAKKNQPKLKRARKVAQRKRAPKAIIKKRAARLARHIVRTKFAGKLGASYANLSPSQKINIDKMIAKKQGVIKKIAMRLIPRVQQLEAQRLAAFLKGRSMKNVNEEMSLNEKFQLLLNNKQEEKVKKTEHKKNKYIIMHAKFKDVYNEESSEYLALEKKSDKSGISFGVLGEVFLRGLDAYDENETRVTQEQYAFARVNSYINKGKTYFAEDADLHELEDKNLMELSKRVLRNYASKVHSRVKSEHPAGHNPKYHAMLKKEYGKDDPEVKMLDRDVKKHQNRKKGYERASKKLGGFDQEKHIERHVKISDRVRKHFEKKGNRHVMGHDPDKKGHVIVRKQVKSGVRSKNSDDYKDVSVHHSKVKVKEDLQEMEVDSAKREVGTDSSVKNYTDDTPGQDLSWKKMKTFKEVAMTDDQKDDEGNKVNIHTNAADRKMIKATTPDGKTIWKKAARSKDIVK